MLYHHEDWNDIASILKHGIKYPMTEPPTEQQRKDDIVAMIERGNHPSVQRDDHYTSLKTAYDKEVRHGWLIPITIQSLLKLEHAAVIPLGVADQFTV